MKQSRYVLSNLYSINSIRSFHYFEFAKDFIYNGESHNFWEFLYVDKGEIEVMADHTGFKLYQGDIIFHKPNEFHSVWANKVIAPNVFIIEFDCKSSAMSFFENKIFSIGNKEQQLLSNLLREGLEAFKPPYNDPYNSEVHKNMSAFEGCEQLVKIYLQTLLINIYRKYKVADNSSRLYSCALERTENEFVSRIDMFMDENINSNLTLSDFCSYLNMSRTQLSTMYKKLKGKGAVEHFREKKIEYSKKLIREENLNFSQISELLGYSGIHSFSRQFRTIAGMSPSEYSKSIRARI